MIDPMIIQYPSAHTWTKKITNDAFFGFGKNHVARLKTTLRKIESSSVRYNIEPLTPKILDWFTPHYVTTIREKNNPKINDIFENTLGKNGPHPYFALILTEDGNRIGATIFSTRSSSLSFAYRIFPNQWQSNNLPAGPSLYAEYLMNSWAFTNGFARISHGKDRNPYGLNASIGLALFKLSVGCAVELPKGHYDTKMFDLDGVTNDILLFEMPTPDTTKITRAYLCVQKDTLHKYESLTKYEHVITTTVLLRD